MYVVRLRNTFLRAIIYVAAAAAAVILFFVVRISNDPDFQRNGERRDTFVHHKPSAAKIRFCQTPSPRFDATKVLACLSVQLVKIDTSNIRDKPQACTPIKFAVFETQLRSLSLSSLFSDATVIEVSENDPRLRNHRDQKKSINRPITTHIFVCSGALVYHFPVLIDRGTFYWIGKIDAANIERIDGRCCARNREQPATAIDKLILEPVRVTSIFGVFQPANKALFAWHLPNSRFLECDLENVVWQFNRIYPSFVERQNDKNITESLLELRKFSLFHEFPMVLFGSTLLGWRRSCDRISYANHVDLAIERELMSEALFRQLYEKFWVAKRYGKFASDRVLCPGAKSCGLELVVYSKTGVKMSLFTIQQNDDRVTFSDYYHFPRHNTLYRNMFGNFTLMPKCTVELLGALAYAPCEPMVPIKAEYDVVQWFQPTEDKISHNLDYVRNFTDGEYRELNFVYSLHKCKKPTIAWGCDEPPTGPPVAAGKRRRQR